MNPPTSSEILQKTKELLTNEGLNMEEINSENKLKEVILPALSNSRDIQSALYSYEPPHVKGTVRKYKNLILSKLRNIIINVLERLVMRQQKYNELNFQALSEINARLEKLEQQSTAK